MSRYDHSACLQNADELEDKIVRLRAALRLGLIFHKPGPLSEEDKQEWFSITGHAEITARYLCDHIRKALSQ